MYSNKVIVIVNAYWKEQVSQVVSGQQTSFIMFDSVLNF
jgi:hypothetical protein